MAALLRNRATYQKPQEEEDSGGGSVGGRSVRKSSAFSACASLRVNLTGLPLLRRLLSSADWKSDDEAAVPTAPAVSKRSGLGRPFSRRVNPQRIKPQLDDGADDDADCIALEEGPPKKKAKKSF